MEEPAPHEITTAKEVEVQDATPPDCGVEGLKPSADPQRHTTTIAKCGAAGRHRTAETFLTQKFAAVKDPQPRQRG